MTGLLDKGLQLVNYFAPIGAEFVAVEGTRKYLLMGQSADELRATGGFVSALWLVTFENGGLTDLRYHDRPTSGKLPCAGTGRKPYQAHKHQGSRRP